MPAVPDLQSGGVQLSLEAPPGTASLLTWSKDHFAARLAERSCIIVYADGRYRMEKSSQRFLESMTTHAFEGTLSSAQITDLHKILDSPELANLRHNLDQTRPASEVEVTRLVIHERRQFSG